MVVSINKFELSTELVTVTDQKADFPELAVLKKRRTRSKPGFNDQPALSTLLII